MARTPAQLAIIRAFRDLIDSEGKDEASAFLSDLGDIYSLWPSEPDLSADDLNTLASQLLVRGMTTVPCSRRGEFLEAMGGVVEATLRVVRGKAPKVAA